MLHRLVFATAAMLSNACSTAQMPDPGPIGRAVLNTTRTAVTLAFATGERRVETPDAPGDMFGAPRLSSDRRTAGWVVDRIDGASYPSPIGLQFVHHGMRRGFGCDAGVPWGWRFARRGRIVVDCGFPHGGSPHALELVVIDTAKIIAVVVVPDGQSVAPGAPAWAREAIPDD